MPKVKGPTWELEGLDSGAEKGAIYSGRVLMREGTFPAQRGRKSPGSRFLAVWCPGKVHRRAMGLPPHRKPACGARGEATLPVSLTCDSGPLFTAGLFMLVGFLGPFCVDPGTRMCKHWAAGAAGPGGPPGC